MALGPLFWGIALYALGRGFSDDEAGPAAPAAAPEPSFTPDAAATTPHMEPEAAPTPAASWPAQGSTPAAVPTPAAPAAMPAAPPPAAVVPAAMAPAPAVVPALAPAELPVSPTPTEAEIAARALAVYYTGGGRDPEVIARYQSRLGVQPTGVVGPDTVHAAERFGAVRFIGPDMPGPGIATARAEAPTRAAQTPPAPPAARPAPQAPAPAPRPAPPPSRSAAAPAAPPRAPALAHETHAAPPAPAPAPPAPVREAVPARAAPAPAPPARPAPAPPPRPAPAPAPPPRPAPPAPAPPPARPAPAPAPAPAPPARPVPAPPAPAPAPPARAPVRLTGITRSVRYQHAQRDATERPQPEDMRRHPVATHPTTEHMTGDVFRAAMVTLQHQLNDLGYTVERYTGVETDDTRRAFPNFARDHGELVAAAMRTHPGHEWAAKFDAVDSAYREHFHIPLPERSAHGLDEVGMPYSLRSPLWGVAEGFSSGTGPDIVGESPLWGMGRK